MATNVYGAENVVKAALQCGVQRVLALSTDKAVNPVNLYGATKLCMEKIFIAANALAAGQCRFSVMRYGNVVGSRGSVIPLFKKLAAEGKPLTITDTRMTRFWITLEQAVEFTLRCLGMMEGREIFVPKIPSMKITDLADAISAGNWVCTGIRPGEKIHETLITEDETPYVAEHVTYYVISPGKMLRSVISRPYKSDTNDQWLSVVKLKDIIHAS